MQQPQFDSRTLLEVKEVFRTLGWKFFESYINDKARELHVEARIQSESILNLLQREQTLGACHLLEKLVDDFKTHVEQQLKQQLKEEDKHA